MKIVDLEEKDQELYFVCLEDWSEDMKEAGDHKKNWFGNMKDKGLRVKIALDDNGNVGGMIEYMPIEHSFAEGSNLYFVNCIWVHGYDKGRGNFQKKGMGKALLKAAEDDAKSLGSKGLVVWGMAMPYWMSAQWYEKQGYEKVDMDEGSVLLWKSFSNDAKPPKWIKKEFKPSLNPGKVTVTSFFSGQCPSGNIVHERAKKAAASFGDAVVFQEIRTSDKETMRMYGVLGALFVEDENIFAGGPPSYEDILKAIKRKLSDIGTL
jgi:GNAT superfamily N-acetyltransferase